MSRKYVVFSLKFVLLNNGFLYFKIYKKKLIVVFGIVLYCVVVVCLLVDGVWEVWIMWILCSCFCGIGE